ncbi:transposase [Desulfosporosinus sp. BICA1-9]|uniref:IS1634 family transposase n=1 Tax=Desulfosporosinus sp. BICA1-9 TaxID=1531958 RepID=UPI0025C22F46|nr:transposase [Desulfosporosinus sp. BICA1-9]
MNAPLFLRGHSKDSRPDLPQIVIGLAVTRDGIPIRCWSWPGNTSDMTVIPEVKRDLIGWKLGRVVTVADRGFSSEENLRVLQQAGGHYIVGERMTAGKPIVEKALSHPGRFRTVRDNLDVKEVIIGNGEAGVRYVLVRNPIEADGMLPSEKSFWIISKRSLQNLRNLMERCIPKPIVV